MAKPRISILDPRFKYRNAANTDVGLTIRRAMQNAKREQLAKEGRLVRIDAPTATVRTLRKRGASC